MKRVIITSSVVAAWEPKPDTNPPYVWTESDWNTDAAKQVEEKGGAGAGAVQIYFASKVRPYSDLRGWVLIFELA